MRKLFIVIGVVVGMMMPEQSAPGQPDNAPEVIIESVSPNGNVYAIVEQDARAAYLYLYGDESTEFGVRSCWVRNLANAPDTLNVDEMGQGIPPMLPQKYLRGKAPQAPLVPEQLEIVWFEEGDAAALLENSEILAIIPGWSGEQGFSGYARDCQDENSLCWPLGTKDTNRLFERVERAQRYWRAWEAEKTPWTDIQTGFLETYQASLGNYEKYYAIDGGVWPPKAMIRVSHPQGTLLVTLGVAVRPQPTVEMYVENPQEVRRFELAIGLDKTTSEETIEHIARYISGQTNLPWSLYTWFGNGHTVPCDSAPHPDFTSVLLAKAPPEVPAVPLGSVQGDPVNLLWLIPITEEERQYAIDHTSEKLLNRLEECGVTWIYTQRESCIK